MKNSILVLILSLFLSPVYGQSLLGAWENISQSEDGQSIRNVVIFSESYQVSTWYEADTGAFINTNGGSWELDGIMLTETVEFDTKKPERVGSQVTFEIDLGNNTLKAKDFDRVWNRVDDGSPGALAGAWLMSGRKKKRGIATTGYQ